MSKGSSWIYSRIRTVTSKLSRGMQSHLSCCFGCLCATPQIPTQAAAESHTSSLFKPSSVRWAEVPHLAMCTCNLGWNIPLNRSLKWHVCSCFPVVTIQVVFMEKYWKTNLPWKFWFSPQTVCFACVRADGGGLSLLSKMLMGILSPGLWDSSESHRPFSRTKGRW